jgi:CheY-like chemotaxis protein
VSGRVPSSAGKRLRRSAASPTVVAHEIRGPLGVVITLADMLLARELGASERQLVELMRLAGSHVLGVADDLVAEASLAADRMTIVAAVFDPADTVRGLEALWAPVAAGAGRRVTVDVAPGTPASVASDEGRVRQILFNLVSNATRHADGPIGITVRGRGRSIVFEVSDEGSGSTHARGQAGLGIGLWISQRLAEALGGHLRFATRRGGGTVARLTIPAGIPARRPPASRPDPTSRDDQPDGGSGTGGVAAQEAITRARVLVVDDSPVSRMLLTTMLTTFGLSVVTAADGREATASATEARPDIVVVDWALAGETGAEVLARIRSELGPSMPPAVIVSADARFETVPGVVAIVRKPFSARELHAAVARALPSPAVASAG